MIIFVLAMKKIVMIFAAALLVAGTASCIQINGLPFQIVRGNGVQVEQVIDAHDFNDIEVVGSMDVVFTQGPESVVLTADENLVEYYVIEASDGSLKITSKRGYTLMHKAKTFVAVSAPDLTKVRIAGSGDCDIQGDLLLEGDLALRISGSGDIETGRVVCKDFSAKIAGSGDIEAEAIEAGDVQLSISGSGDIDVEAVTASAVSIGISGSGDAAIGCKDAGDVSARISGSGSVRLWGSATSLDSHVSGSGRVNSRDLELK